MMVAPIIPAEVLTHDRATTTIPALVDNGNKVVGLHPDQLRQERSRLIRRLVAFTGNPSDPDLIQAAESYLDRLNGCGRTPIGAGVSIFRSVHGHSVMGGVYTCHDRWCPVCAAKIEAKEAMKTRNGLLHLHHSGELEGRSLFHLVVTMAHSRNDDQRQNMTIFLDSLEALLRSQLWRRYVQGYLLKIEVEGISYVNGLHPHAHVLVILENASDVPPKVFAKMVETRFMEELEKHGASADWGDPTTRGWFRHAHDASNLPFYLTKKRWGLVEEFTASQAKNGGFTQRPLEDLVLCRDLTSGVRLLRAGGIIRKAMAEAAKQREETAAPEALIPIINVPSTLWSNRPELHEPIQLMVEDPTLDPEWIAEVIAELFELTPTEAAIFLREVAA